MVAAHSVWTPEVREQQSREYRREIEHGWFRVSSQVMKGEYPGVVMMTEQQIVDALNSFKAPHYQRHSGKIDPCGHRDCTYHGLCILAEYRGILNDEEIVNLVQTSTPISREAMCHCGHRCKSKRVIKHTYENCECLKLED